MPLPVRYDAMHFILIDGNPENLQLMRSSIAAAFRDVCESTMCDVYSSAAEAMAGLQLVPIEEDVPTVVICDSQVGAPGVANWLTAFIRSESAPVIITTDSDNEEAEAAVLRAGASDYIHISRVFADLPELRRIILDSLRRYEEECTAVQLSRKLKKAYSELAVKSKHIERISDTAHRFVEDVAHDFRTPLTVIQEFVSLMRDGFGGPVTEQNMEFLGQISSATRDLARLVDDFLDAGKLQAGRLSVNRRAVPIEEVLDGIWPMLTVRADRSHIHLERHTAPDMPQVYIDVDQSRRAIVNLVVNAIKFSPLDSLVTVSMTHEHDMVRIAVTDRGVGLDKGAVKSIFERFEQAKANETHGAQGFGLGLSIVAQLVHLNFGKVEVKSEPGKGSTFSVLFPIATPQAVLPRFIDELARHDARAKIVALDVSYAPGEQHPDHMGSLLRSLSRAWDLAVPKPSGKGFVIIGASEDAEAWASRLRNHPRASGPNTPPDRPSGLRCDVFGQWPLKEALEKVQALVPFLGGETHAAHDSHR